MVPLSQHPDRARSPSRSTPASSGHSAFRGPARLLLHLIESAELDILTVPLARVADAYVSTWPATRWTPPTWRRSWPPPPSSSSSSRVACSPPTRCGPAPRTIDEEELRRRLVAYRAIAMRRGAGDVTWAARCGTVSRARPTCPRPRAEPILRILLSRLWTAWPRSRSPAPEPPEIVRARGDRSPADPGPARRPRPRGQVVLQPVLAGSRSRTERAVTLLATLELVRRRQATCSRTAVRTDRPRADAGTRGPRDRRRPRPGRRTWRRCCSSPTGR